jgi:glycosyltransferase involved in cell wall biosynthesis
MTETPVLVTVGIPSYMCAGYVAEAIASALSQEVDGLEVLVVDDASTDGTMDVIAGLDDPRLRVLRNDSNIGPGRNWNRVVAEARGRYIKVMGCDDVLLPGSLAAEVAVLESEPGVEVVTGARELVGEGGRRFGRRGNGGLSGRVSGDVAGREMVRRGSNLVGEPCATLLRTESVRKVGGFDESEPYCIDMDLWVRLLARGDLYVLDGPVACYRIVGTSWSASVGRTQDADVTALLRRTVEAGTFGATAADAEAGSRHARRLAFYRRLLYLALFDSETRRRLLYLVVGGWNTLFGYLAFSALYYLLSSHLNYVLIFIAAYSISTLNAYWGYKRFVFKTATRFIEEFPRFALVYVGALAVNLVVFPWLTTTLGLNPYLSQVLFTVVLVVTTYIVNQRFSFR